MSRPFWLTGTTDVALEMRAPDGTLIERVPFWCGGWRARWQGRSYPILGGIRGPLFLTGAWGAWGARRA